MEADSLLLPAAQTHGKGGWQSLAPGAWVPRKAEVLSCTAESPKLPTHLLSSQALASGSPGVSRSGSLWGATWGGLQWEGKGVEGTPCGRGERERVCG